MGEKMWVREDCVEKLGWRLWCLLRSWRYIYSGRRYGYAPTLIDIGLHVHLCMAHGILQRSHKYIWMYPHMYNLYLSSYL